MSERSLRSVPKSVIVLLILSLSAQVSWRLRTSPAVSEVQILTPPPKDALLSLVGFGDSLISAKLLMLWLQSFNSQNGRFINYQQLDYTVLIQWLETLLRLDPKGQYPLLAASHLYSIVPDPQKQRQILEFVYQQFFIDPARRWPWLAQATLLAKHRLKDLTLALKYSQALTTYATPNTPYRVQELQILILEEMGEFVQAQQVIEILLDRGQITDPTEISYLDEHLKVLTAKILNRNRQ